MLLTFRLNPALPPLAWIAKVHSPDDVVEVEHGALVETGTSFFVEGAWAGAFDAGRPDAAAIVFGSGACVDDGRVVFVPSTATTDYLYYRQQGSSTTVANSLALLLASVGDTLDPQFMGYAEINNSIMRGIRAYERRIPTRAGDVRRLLHNNLVIEGGVLTEVPKPEEPELPTYEDYAAYLASSYQALVENARHPARRHAMRVYGTQSRGYDTTAINAVAARHGMDGVFTIRTGKGGGGTSADDAFELEVDDDGTEIARTLGIGPVIAVERRAFARAFEDEVYFHASISECQDANMKAMSAGIQAPALLLTGTLGEMWYTQSAWYDDHQAYLSDELRRIDIGGHGLTEVRLRAGYVQVAIPYIGARRREQLLAITESAAMDPWRLRTSYDRPLPRRLAEEAGVPRDAFGQVKIGSVVEFAVPQWPQGQELRLRFLSFLRAERVLPAWKLPLLGAVRRINETVWFSAPHRHRAVYLALRAASKLLRRDVARPILWNELRGSLFCFAVNACVVEYERALAAPTDGAP